jgi:hypothetical protein
MFFDMGMAGGRRLEVENGNWQKARQKCKNPT